MRRAACCTFALGVALALPAIAPAAPSPALARCVSAWNRRAATDLKPYVAATTRRVRLTAVKARSTDVGGVRSINARQSVVQSCILTIFGPSRRATRVSGIWINGTVRVWKRATSTLAAGSTPTRNARLLADGTLSAG